MKRPHWLNLAKTLLSLVAVGFLVFAVIKGAQALIQQQVTLSPAPLLGAVIFCMVFFLIQSIGWKKCLDKMDPRLSLGQGISSWFISQVVKYVPGKMMLPVYRTMLAGRAGVAKSHVLLSIMVELVLMIASAGLVFLVMLPFLSDKIGDQVALPLLILCCIIGLLAIHPKIMNFGVNKALTLAKRDPVTIDFSYGSMISLLLFFITGWLIYGASAVMTILAMGLPLTGGYEFYFALTAGFAISWVIGFLSFLTPGGIGVREGVLVLALSPFMATSAAFAVAILSRLIWIVCEILGTAATFALRPKPGDDSQ